MDVRYSLDAEKGAGYGFFVVRECEGGDGRYNVQLQRSVDLQFLAASGDWVDTQQQFSLEGTRDEDGLLWLSLEPILVNALNITDIYRFTLESQECSRKTCVLKIQEIRYSEEINRNNTVEVQRVEQELPPRKEVTTVEKKEEEEEEKKEEEQREEKTPKKTLPRFLLPLLLIVLLLLGAVGWKALQDENPPVETPKEENTAGTSSQAGQKEETQENQGSQKPRTLSTEESVHEFFKSPNRSTQRADELIRTLHAETVSEKDAVFRLYYYAIQNGDESAWMNYAACLDPLKPKWGTIEKNGYEAWEIYEKAKAGNAGAAKDQEALLRWLKAEEAKGNRKAIEWLGQLPKSALQTRE